MTMNLTTKACAPLVRQFGAHSLAYATLQPGMAYFGDAGRGFIAYRRRLGQYVVLGDPVCPAAEHDGLLRDFLDFAPGALFMQVHRDTAITLAQKGYRKTPVGVENDINTATFALDGRRKRDLRHYRNKARKAGVVVREEEDTPELRRRLLPISEAWLPTKSWFAHELEFLARPFVTQPEPGVRIFTGAIDGETVGFVILDPMYRDEHVIGYTVDILRHYPDTPEGTCDYINLCIIEQMRDEGIPRVSLGVSPFHRMRDQARAEGHGAWPVYTIFRGLYRWGNPIYHFRGLSFHKSRYRALETPVYTCVRGPIGLLPLYASARACRML